MPVVVRIDGVVIRMYFQDHNPPHLHGSYGEYEAVFALNGDLLEGTLPKGKVKEVQKYIDNHQEFLQECWEKYSS